MITLPNTHTNSRAFTVQRDRRWCDIGELAAASEPNACRLQPVAARLSCLAARASFFALCVCVLVCLWVSGLVRLLQSGDWSATMNARSKPTTTTTAANERSGPSNVCRACALSSAVRAAAFLSLARFSVSVCYLLLLLLLQLHCVCVFCARLGLAFAAHSLRRYCRCSWRRFISFGC